MNSFIVVPQTSSGLPLWQTAPLSVVGVAIAFGLLWGASKLAELPGELRIRRRVRQVEAAAGTAPPFNPQAVYAAATRVFREVQEAWDKEDRDRLGAVSDPDLMSDWVKRMDGYAATGTHYRVKIRGGPRLDYLGLRADRGQVRLRVRAKLHRYLETPKGKRRLPGDRGSFQEYWTFSWSGTDWVASSTRDVKRGHEYLHEQIVPRGATEVGGS